MAAREERVKQIMMHRKAARRIPTAILYAECNGKARPAVAHGRQNQSITEKGGRGAARRRTRRQTGAQRRALSAPSTQAGTTSTAAAPGLRRRYAGPASDGRGRRTHAQEGKSKARSRNSQRTRPTLSATAGVAPDQGQEHRPSRSTVRVFRTDSTPCAARKRRHGAHCVVNTDSSTARAEPAPPAPVGLRSRSRRVRVAVCPAAAFRVSRRRSVRGLSAPRVSASRGASCPTRNQGLQTRKTFAQRVTHKTYKRK